uniref:FAD/NAD(P)-binding domain-containing protein n=1 Tax=Pseudo-nitzschia australis TaxID=44445 RepID=A0A7S4A929_9STRA
MIFLSHAHLIYIEYYEQTNAQITKTNHSGIVAIEFAKIFSNLGCNDVTLLIRDNSPKHALMKIGLDKDIAATLVADLIRSGIKIERGCEVGAIEVPSFGATAANKNLNFIVPLKINLKSKGGVDNRSENLVQEVKCDAYIAAVGRIPNTEKLNLEAAGIEVDSYGGIVVDSQLRAKGAADGNVYGAGDVLGRPFLASTGVAQGVATVKNMFGLSVSPDRDSCDDSKELCGVEDELLSNAAACDPTSLAANPVSVHLLNRDCSSKNSQSQPSSVDSLRVVRFDFYWYIFWSIFLDLRKLIFFSYGCGNLILS